MEGAGFAPADLDIYGAEMGNDELAGVQGWSPAERVVAGGVECLDGDAPPPERRDRARGAWCCPLIA